GDDEGGMTEKDLLDQDIGKVLMIAARDVFGQHFDSLDIDRATKPGDESARPPRIVDARPKGRGDGSDTTNRVLDCILRVSGELFRIGLPPCQLSKLPVGFGNGIKVPGKQLIGNIGLLLDPFGKRYERRTR